MNGITLGSMRLLSTLLSGLLVAAGVAQAPAPIDRTKRFVASITGGHAPETLTVH